MCFGMHDIYEISLAEPCFMAFFIYVLGFLKNINILRVKIKLNDIVGVQYLLAEGFT